MKRVKKLTCFFTKVRRRGIRFVYFGFCKRSILVCLLFLVICFFKCCLMCLLVSFQCFVASSVYGSYNNIGFLSDLSSPGSMIWDSFDGILNC